MSIGPAVWLAGAIAVFVYALKWGFWWALLIAPFWIFWLAYRGISALLSWMAL